MMAKANGCGLREELWFHGNHKGTRTCFAVSAITAYQITDNGATVFVAGVTGGIDLSEEAWETLGPMLGFVETRQQGWEKMRQSLPCVGTCG